MPSERLLAQASLRFAPTNEADIGSLHGPLSSPVRAFTKGSIRPRWLSHHAGHLGAWCARILLAKCGLAIPKSE